MTDNTATKQTEVAKSGLIYGLNDRPPLRETLFAAAQHLLAIFVAIVTPPLIIASALKLDTDTTSFLVSMSLMVSGVATFIQCRRIGPVGCGLLCIQGTSFSFIGPIIAAGVAGGLPAVFGATVAGSVVEMFVSRILKYARRVVTPLVSGIVVTLIGMSLIKVGISACGGGEAAKAAGTFGSIENVGIAALVLVLIVFFNRSSNRYLRMGSIVIGLVVGYAVSWSLGMVDFGSVQSYGGFNYPNPFKYGLSFDISSIIGLGLVYLITSIEAYGDFIAGMLVLLGVFPAVGIVFSLMPSPVLGGATLLMFGTVAAAGIRIIASQTINRKATLVMAISFSLGLSVELVPEILSQLPSTVQSIFSSGITTGGLAAIISNLVIRIKE